MNADISKTIKDREFVSMNADISETIKDRELRYERGYLGKYECGYLRNIRDRELGS